MRTRFLAKCLLAAMALAVGIIGVGSVRTPTAPVQGAGLGSQFAPLSGMRVRVASFNMHSGRDPKGASALDLAARTVQGFDLVGLGEVYHPLRPGTPPQVAQLAGGGQAWLFAPAERQYWNGRFGNGLISSIPITSWRTVPLPAPKEHSRKNLIIAQSPISGGCITFLITHITRGQDKDEQLRFVEKLFLDQPAPAILMGDLNATSEHPLIQGLLQTPGVGNPLDEKMPQLAGRHIDWIFTRGLQTRDAGTRDLSASDHPLVWAELAVLPPSPPATSASTQP